MFGVAAMVQYLYPKLLALHDLANDVCIPDPAGIQIRLPSFMRCSYIWMENNGIYLIGPYIENVGIKKHFLTLFTSRQR